MFTVIIACLAFIAGGLMMETLNRIDTRKTERELWRLRHPAYRHQLNKLLEQVSNPDGN